MTKRSSTNTVVLIDAAGCFIGACLILVSTTVWAWTDLPDSWRLPVGLVLLAFSIVLVLISRFLSRKTVATAVLGNVAWITGGAIALFVTGTILGGVIIGLVMIGDAIMAWLQAQQLLENRTLSHTTSSTQGWESGS